MPRFPKRGIFVPSACPHAIRLNTPMMNKPKQSEKT